MKPLPFLDRPVIYAPLAGVSDYPYRQMSARYRPGLMYCEMVKMDPLVRYERNTFHMLDYEASMHPIGAQLCGSKPRLAKQAARIIEDLGFDVLDLNCGCPVDKVTKDGSGSGMLKTPELIGEILSEMVAAVDIPVTVKIRSGWDDNTIVTPHITRIAEQAGAQAIAIHGRTRQQGYKGDADWGTIKAAKEAATSIKVIGNGDIFDGYAAKRMIEETGCDAVLAARGTMGQPWIAEDIFSVFAGNEPKQRTIEDSRKALYEHFQLLRQYHTPRQILVDMRRIGCYYLKKSPHTREFRSLIAKAGSVQEIEDLILNFALEEMCV